MSDGPTAIVTGGSAGIGAAICRLLLEAEYDVVSLDRAAPGWSHPRLRRIEVDLVDPGATREAAAEAAARGPVTRLVHNAGAIRPALVETADPSDIEALARLHLGAPLILLQALLPAMKVAREGRVILISSRAALGAATRTAYSATKAGMIGMARTWALELAPHGITVNVVAPGPVGGTDQFHSIIPAGSEREAALARAIPAGRLGTPDDVANAVLFFADAASGFITGQTLYVCGGASVGTLLV